MAAKIIVEVVSRERDLAKLRTTSIQPSKPEDGAATGTVARLNEALLLLVSMPPPDVVANDWLGATSPRMDALLAALQWLTQLLSALEGSDPHRRVPER
jgi:hypothetical protein